MKTNQIMVRKMGEHDVEQRTSDGFFNATALLRSWNGKEGNTKRDIDNFWKSTNLPEFMSEIADNEHGIKSVDFTELKTMLSRTHKGKSGGTWMHPVLFIKFAMYLSPKFEYHVLKFVSDQMIEYRKDSGNAYKLLSSEIAKLIPPDEMPQAMSKIAEAINHCVVNKHETGIRNQYGEEEIQREYLRLQLKITDLVHEGFLNKVEDIIEYLRDRWREKYTPEAFSKRQQLKRNCNEKQSDKRY